VQARRPDLMVIDLNLPDIDGHALLRALRVHGGLADTPAFLCTAEHGARVHLAAIEAGFKGCWAKPVGQGDLIRELSMLGLAPTTE
jgi:CheY-like chemotaxis protein